jgi:hypothetical protein
MFLRRTITGNFTLDLADQWAKTNIQSARNESTMRRVENLGIESVREFGCMVSNRLRVRHIIGAVSFFPTMDFTKHMCCSG